MNQVNIDAVLNSLIRRSSRYVIYGAGIRGVQVVSFIKEHELPLPVAILDDSPRAPHLQDIPIFRPEDIRDQSFDFILLASDTFQKQMENRIQEIWGQDQLSIRLFKERVKCVKRPKAEYATEHAVIDILHEQHRIQYEEGTPIRIAFLFQAASFWPSWESVWEQVSHDNRFDVHMLLFDRVIGEKSQTLTARHFLETKGIPYTVADEFDFDAFRPHIVVYQTPYDSHFRPPYLWTSHMKARGTRIAYIPYGIDINDTEEGRCTDKALVHLKAWPWRIYTLSAASREEFFLYSPFGGFNVRVTGHPKFDGLFNAQHLPMPEAIRERAQGRRIVLWKIHFPKTLDVGNGRCGMVTPDLDEYLQFAEHIPNYPDLFFVLMPHPKFDEPGARCDIFDRTNALVKRVADFENGFVYRGDDYRPPLVNADFIMIDRSAVMVEAGAMGVPVLMMKNHEFNEPQPPPIKPLIESYYQGTRCQDMLHFLDMCRSGQDPNREIRHAAFAQCVPHFDGQCGRRIINDIVQSLQTEARQTTHTRLVMPPRVPNRGAKTPRLIAPAGIERLFDTMEGETDFKCSASYIELQHLAWIGSQIPHQGIVVELGSYRGRTAGAIALGTRQAGRCPHIYAIDLWRTGKGLTADRYTDNQTWKIFLARLDHLGIRDQVSPIMGATSIVFTAWGKRPVDFLFIDANHTYKFVKQDFALWGNLVRPGGRIAFHDYCDKFDGVKRVVEEEVKKSGQWEEYEVVGNLWSARRRMDAQVSTVVTHLPQELEKISLGA